MDNQITTSPLADLPVATKEKVTRGVFYLGAAALVVAGINFFMPFVNRALTLMINGVWSIAELAIAGAVTAGTIFVILTVAPLFKRFIESCANKATWALFEYDPITPLELWLKEVHRDRQTLDAELLNVDGVIAEDQQMVRDNRNKAEKADKNFATAVKQFGEESTQAKLMAIEPGRLRETADRIEKQIEPLITVRDILQQVVEAVTFTERAAELDVDGLRQEFKVAANVQQATDSANRVLVGRSERKENAEMAMKIIHDKYAQQFGRLQGLQRLSRELITSVDMTKGTYHQEALDRLKQESQFIIGGKPQARVLEAKPVGQANDIKFYSTDNK
jgi:hypothetical protein